jgi:hypothetical protein
MMAHVLWDSKRVWVDDGHVFLEDINGITFTMIPEVALRISRSLGSAGGDSLINKIMDEREAKPSE